MLKPTLEYWENALPFVDVEHAIQGGFFYKSKERKGEEEWEKMKVRIGLKVVSFQQFQVDHIVYLIQKINCHLEWCKLIVTGGQNLFIEACLDFKNGEEVEQSYIKR